MRCKKWISFVVLVCLLVPLQVLADSEESEVVDPAPFEDALQSHLHEEYNGIAKIDYASWRKDDEAQEALDAYLEEVEEANLEGTTKAARGAFWLNVYNALVIDRVLEKGPFESRTSSVRGWRNDTFEVAGKQRRLKEIREAAIAGDDGDRRGLFAVTCYGLSCQHIRRDVPTGENLEESLRKAEEAFIYETSDFRMRKAVENSEPPDHIVVRPLFDRRRELFTSDDASLGDYFADRLVAEMEKLQRINERAGVENMNWKPWYALIEGLRAGDVEIEFDFMPRPSERGKHQETQDVLAGKAAITVYTFSSGEVLLDGEKTGETADEENRPTLFVEPGEHEIQVDFGDETSKTKTVDVEERARVKILFESQDDKDGDSSKPATVTVYSKPRGTIMIDGEKVDATTPATVEVEPGLRKVQVDFDGQLSEEKKVECKGGRRIKLFIRKKQ